MLYHLLQAVECVHLLSTYTLRKKDNGFVTITLLRNRRQRNMTATKVMRKSAASALKQKRHVSVMNEEINWRLRKVPERENGVHTAFI